MEMIVSQEVLRDLVSLAVLLLVPMAVVQLMVLVVGLTVMPPVVPVELVAVMPV